MNNELKLFAATALAGAAVGFSVIKHIKTRRQQRAERDEISIQLDLDLDALRRTSEQIRMRAMLGEFRGFASYEIEKAFHDEYAFQKIAVRES